MQVRIIAALIFIAVLPLGSCDYQSDKKHEPYTDLMLALDQCSPFLDLANKRMLIFSTGTNTVDLSEMIPSATDKPGTDVLSSKNNKKTRGAFAMDARTKTLAIVFNGNRSEYLEFEPADSDVCILLHGSMQSADLSSSWYGIWTRD